MTIEEFRQPPAALALTSDPIMTAAFVGTLKITESQIQILRRPVKDDEVEWKPAKQDGPAIIPYLPHNGYRDRLDAAFGLGGWGMVPLATPKEVKEAIYIPFALVIDGVPRVYAWGEQQLHKMTYGDGIEGAKSNAIARCGKELGIARELWDKPYVAALLARKGKVPADGSTRASSPAPAYHAKEKEPITEGQRKRLFMIVKNSGRTETEIRMWLKAKYNIDASKDIQRRDYEAICTAIEAPGGLDVGAAREPGEEG